MVYYDSAGIEASPVLVVLWAVFVGFVFSTVGAAGGILSGVGHITLMGIGDANIIKVMNQGFTRFEENKKIKEKKTKKQKNKKKIKLFQMTHQQ